MSASLSNSHLLDILSGLKDFVVQTDLDGNFLFCNRLAAQFKESDIVGKSIFDFIPEEQHEEVKELLKNVVATKQTKFYYTVGPGEEKHSWSYYQSWVSPVINDDKVTSLIVTSADITESELNRRKLKQLAKVSAAILWQWNIPKNSFEFNSVYSDELSEVLEKIYTMEDFIAMISPPQRDDAQRLITEIKSGKLQRIEMKVQIQTYKNKVSTFLLKGALSQMDNSGVPVIITGALLNIDYIENLEAEKNRADMQLVQSSRLAQIGELAAGIGHEINNPLAILMGFQKQIKKLIQKENESYKNSNLERLLEKQEIAMNRIFKIVKGLKQLSQNADQKLQSVNLHSIIEEDLDLTEGILSSEGIQVIKEFGSINPMIKGVPGKLHQILVNLITNAKDALANTKNAKIIISTADGINDEIILKVRDTGDGIPPGILNRIFDPFFTTKTDGRGTGIGLGIVKNFVQEIRGTILVNSSPREYTEFILSFPSAEKFESLNDTQPVLEESPKKRKMKVLVVDDEPDIRDLVGMMLREKNIEFDECSNGQEALNTWDSSKYDLLITDIKMPTMTGVELIQQLVQNHGITMSKVVVITGGVQEEEFKNFMNRHKDEFKIIYKPFKESDLLEAVLGPDFLSIAS